MRSDSTAIHAVIMLAGNPRFSSACFHDNRQYMLCADGELIYITVDKDLAVEIRSNASPELVRHAEEWVQETVFDIATFCNADPDTVRDLIMSAITR